jgi:predicted aspartyl protease
VNTRRLLPLLLLCSLAACADPALSRFGAACRVRREADLAITPVRNFLLVPGAVEAQPVLFVVDTGAESTLLTPDAVERYDLPPDPARRSILLGVGGLVRSQNATVHQLAIGSLIRTDQSVGVGAIGLIGEDAPDIAGLLGTDILSRYDVEIDVPARRITLYAVSGCDGFIPWDGAGAAVPVRFNPQGLAFLPLTVDGRPVRALLDSGARVSLMTRRIAASLGVTQAMLDADPVRGGVGVGLASIALRQHRFARVTVGPITLRDMPVNVADMQLPGVDMLLGADWLASRHIWLSYADSTLFIHP